MKSLLGLLFLGVILTSACNREKSVEQKREAIQKNEFTNQAYRKEIQADSLKREAERLLNDAQMLEESAKAYRDSAENI
ncbi:MAG: hypothetical protein ACK40G_14330 [Cytophagaceae bacterium]